MGTIRSEFTIEQFEEAFQRFAHKVPELIPKFERVIAEGSNTAVNLEFIYDSEGGIRKIEVYYWKREKPNEWGESYAFTIEPKEYIDSPHVTKIRYEGGNDKEEKILAWLKELMGDTQPQPRFRLKDMRSFPRKLDLYIPQNTKTRKRKV